jgi:hypothetical protein
VGLSFLLVFILLCFAIILITSYLLLSLNLFSTPSPPSPMECSDMGHISVPVYFNITSGWYVKSFFNLLHFSWDLPSVFVIIKYFSFYKSERICLWLPHGMLLRKVWMEVLLFLFYHFHIYSHVYTLFGAPPLSPYLPLPWNGGSYRNRN